jgi:hypothetical protein
MFAKPLSHTIGFSDLPHIRSWEDAAEVHETHPTVDRWGYGDARVLSVRKTSKGLRPSKSKTCSTLILSKRGEDYVIGDSHADLIKYRKDGGFVVTSWGGGRAFHDLLAYRFWPSALARSLIHVQLDRAGLGYQLNPNCVATTVDVHLYTISSISGVWAMDDPADHIRQQVAHAASTGTLFFPVLQGGKATTFAPIGDRMWAVCGLSVAGRLQVSLAGKRATRPYAACWRWAEAYGRLAGWGKVAAALHAERLLELDPERGARYLASGRGWFGDAYNWLREQDPATITIEHPVWEVLGLAARSDVDPATLINYWNSDDPEARAEVLYRNHIRNWAKAWRRLVLDKTPGAREMHPIAPDGGTRAHHYWSGGSVATVDLI